MAIEVDRTELEDWVSCNISLNEREDIGYTVDRLLTDFLIIPMKYTEDMIEGDINQTKIEDGDEIVKIYFNREENSIARVIAYKALSDHDPGETSPLCSEAFEVNYFLSKKAEDRVPEVELPKTPGSVVRIQRNTNTTKSNTAFRDTRGHWVLPEGDTFHVEDLKKHYHITEVIYDAGDENGM